MQPAGVRLAAAGADRASAGGSGPLYRLREQLLSGLAPGKAVPAAGTTLRAAPDGGWPKPGLELGNQLLPTTVRGMWLYLYLVVDVWSRKVVAWDVAEVESAEIAAELGQRACLKECCRRPSGFGSRQCHQAPLILHADNGNAMRGATLESRLEEMGVLRSFSRPRVSNDNPYSESLFRAVKYRPDYPRRLFTFKHEGIEWVATLCRLVQPPAPPQRHQIRDAPPAPQWSRQQSASSEPRATRPPPGLSNSLEPERCWRQPEEVWINKPIEEPNPILELPLIQAA